MGRKPTIAPVSLKASPIKALKPGPERRMVTVLGHKGLTIRVPALSETGGTYELAFIFRYILLGKPRKITLGSYPAMSLDELEQAYMKAKGHINAGCDPLTERQRAEAEAKAPKPKSYSFADLLDKYLEERVVRLAPAWQRESRRLIELHIRPALGELPLAEVNPGHISKLVDGQRKNPNQAGKIRARLKVILRLSEEWGLRPVGSNPVLAVPMPEKAIRHRTRRLSELEIAALGKTLQSSNEPHYIKVALRLALQAGMRRGEILRLRWEWCDLDRGIITIPPFLEDGTPAHKTAKKIEQPRMIYLCSFLRNDMKAMIRELGNPFVFPARSSTEKQLSRRKKAPNGKLISELTEAEKEALNGPRSLTNLQDPWERIREAAGLSKHGDPQEQDPGLHDLRRTFASIGADLGLKGYMGELLGHAERSVTDLYTRTADHILLDHVESIGKRIQHLLDGTIQPNKPTARPMEKMQVSTQA